MTPATAHPLRLTAGRPTTLAERVEVHDLMRAVCGDAEHVDNPRGRAAFLLDASLIRASNNREENRP